MPPKRKGPVVSSSWRLAAIVPWFPPAMKLNPRCRCFKAQNLFYLLSSSLPTASQTAPTSLRDSQFPPSSPHPSTQWTRPANPAFDCPTTETLHVPRRAGVLLGFLQCSRTSTLYLPG